MNIAELANKEFEQFGKHVSLIFEDREFTNAEMLRAASRLGNALKELRVHRGDRVIIQMPNCPEVAQAFQAVYAIGAVGVPINFLVGDMETAYIYQDTGAETIISTPEFLSKIETCRTRAPALKNVILIGDEVPSQMLSFKDLVDKSGDVLVIEETDDDDLAALIYTAGTTGVPKGVMHTHASLYHNARMQHETINLPPGRYRGPPSLSFIWDCQHELPRFSRGRQGGSLECIRSRSGLCRY